MEYQQYGPQMTSFYLKPLETRRLTDQFFILLIPINFLLWLGIGIYCYITMETHIPNLPHVAVSWYYLTSSLATAVFLVILMTFIMKIFRNSVVPIIKFFIICDIAAMALIIFYLLYIYIDAVDPSPVYKFVSWILQPLALIMIPLLLLMYHLTIFKFTKKVDGTILSQMISEPSRAILGSISTLLFSITIGLLLIVSFLFTVVMIYVQLDYEHEDEDTSLLVLCFFAFSLTGLYVFNFIWNFGFTVMGAFYSDYYSTSGYENQTNIIQSMIKIARYHLGTVSFLSLPIIPTMYALILAFKKNHEIVAKSKSMIVNFFSKVHLISDSTHYASVQTSIYGHSALKSMKEMFDHRQSDPVLFLTANAASLKITAVSTGIAVFVGFIVEIIVLQMNLDHWHGEYWGFKIMLILPMHIILAIIYVSSICQLLIRPAMLTFSIYKMASLRESEELNDSCHL